MDGGLSVGLPRSPVLGAVMIGGWAELELAVACGGLAACEDGASVSRTDSRCLALAAGVDSASIVRPELGCAFLAACEVPASIFFSFDLRCSFLGACESPPCPLRSDAGCSSLPCCGACACPVLPADLGFSSLEASEALTASRAWATPVRSGPCCSSSEAAGSRLVLEVGPDIPAAPRDPFCGGLVVDFERPGVAFGTFAARLAELGCSFFSCASFAGAPAIELDGSFFCCVPFAGAPASELDASVTSCNVVGGGFVAEVDALTALTVPFDFAGSGFAVESDVIAVVCDFASDGIAGSDAAGGLGNAVSGCVEVKLDVSAIASDCAGDGLAELGAAAGPDDAVGSDVRVGPDVLAVVDSRACLDDVVRGNVGAGLDDLAWLSDPVFGNCPEAKLDALANTATSPALTNPCLDSVFCAGPAPV